MLIEFWSWQLFGVPGYEGQPLLAHRALQAATPFRPEHYERWLEVFDDTIDERFTGPTAEMAKARARKMAAAMRRLLSADN
jgi:hemoglobin